MTKIIIAIALLMSLNGCGALGGMVLSGLVGAAVTPLVQPQTDRVLGMLGLDFIDPDGVDKVRKNDAGKPLD
jgi:hypothetical protein